MPRAGDGEQGGRSLPGSSPARPRRRRAGSRWARSRPSPERSRSRTRGPPSVRSSPGSGSERSSWKGSRKEKGRFWLLKITKDGASFAPADPLDRTGPLRGRPLGPAAAREPLARRDPRDRHGGGEPHGRGGRQLQRPLRAPEPLRRTGRPGRRARKQGTEVHRGRRHRGSRARARRSRPVRRGAEEAGEGPDRARHHQAQGRPQHLRHGRAREHHQRGGRPSYAELPRGPL